MKFDIELASYNDNEHVLIVTPEVGGKPFRNIFCTIKDESGDRIFDSQYRGEAVQLRNYIANVLFDNPPTVKVCSGCGVAEGQVCKSTCPHYNPKTEHATLEALSADELRAKGGFPCESVLCSSFVGRYQLKVIGLERDDAYRLQDLILKGSEFYVQNKEKQQVEEATDKYKKILKKKEMPAKIAEGPTTEEQQSRADAEDSLPENRKPEIDTRKPEAETGDSLYVFQPPVPVHPPTAPAADCRLCVGTGRLLVLDETIDPSCYRMMWCPCVHRHASSSSPSRSSDVEDRGPIEDTGPTQEDVRDERGSSSEASDKTQLEYRWMTCVTNHTPVWSNKKECWCGRLGRYYNATCRSCSNRVVPTQAGLCPVCDSVLLTVPEAT